MLVSLLVTLHLFLDSDFVLRSSIRSIQNTESLMQDLVCSSSVYAPIKRLLDTLAFVPPKDDGGAASVAGPAQHRVSVMFEVVNGVKLVVFCSGFSCKKHY